MGRQLEPRGMLVGSVATLAFWGLIIWGIVYAVRSFATGGRRAEHGTPHVSAREVLDDRFVRGEIDRQEYEARRDALSA